jgi:hypothetical protein
VQGPASRIEASDWSNSVGRLPSVGTTMPTAGATVMLGNPRRYVRRVDDVPLDGSNVVIDHDAGELLGMH